MRFFLAVGVAFVALAGVAALAADPQPAGEMQFTTLSGDQFDLAKAGGRGCIVMYFSTDCPHCQQTAERLAPVYRDLKAQGYEIVGLAMNPGAKQNLKTFVQKHKVAFPVGLADRQDFSRFSGQSVMARFYYPYLFFVDKNGVIQEEHQGNERTFFADVEANVRAATARLGGGS